VVILSQLQAFSGESVSIVDMAVPIVSALAFLVGGGYIAVFVLPGINSYFLERIPALTGFGREWVSMSIMFALLLLLMPTTFYAKASPLMGAFLAGLVFCSDKGAHHMFVSQFKRVMQWLLRIFFAASIGFQVPIAKFADATVLLQGFALTIALFGKVIVGFLSPNFSLSKRFRDVHLRDCLVVGFSMAAEGEFAFVIAAYAVTNNMITQELYASIVLAVLVSTILAPFSLRWTISHFKKRSLEDIFGGIDSPSVALEEGIRKQTTIFYCIQTKCEPKWGIQMGIMEGLASLDLDVIDHRSWHPRQSDILVNEIYVKDENEAFAGKDKLDIEKLLGDRIHDVQRLLEDVIGQAEAIVKVQRWYPEPLLPDTGDKPISERLVQATGAALKNSMKEEYVRMAEEKNDINTLQQVVHLDEAFEGRLDGLIRHDPPGLHSDEGFELLYSEDSGRFPDYESKRKYQGKQDLSSPTW